MLRDSTHLIYETDQELCNPETTPERVQELFNACWDNRTAAASIEDDVYVLPIKIVDYVGVAGLPVPRYGVLHFPKNKLSASQIELLEKFQNSPDADKEANDNQSDSQIEHPKSPDADKEADKFILWAAGRAAAIAAVPIPLADVGPLMANEAYMIYRIAETYGFSIDKSVVAMLGGVAGGSIAGKLGASFLPFLKVPIAAGITYAVGKAAKAYFASGMTLSKDALVDVFTNARKEADDIDWNENKAEKH